MLLLPSGECALVASNTVQWSEYGTGGSSPDRDAAAEPSAAFRTPSIARQRPGELFTGRTPNN